MPAAIAIPIIVGAVGAGTAAAATAYAANKQAGASTDNTNAQVAAQKDAAAIQAKTAADALAYAKQKDDLVARQQEATQKANYDQYLARSGGLNMLNTQLGVAPRVNPAYVSMPTDLRSLSTTTTPVPSGGTGGVVTNDGTQTQSSAASSGTSSAASASTSSAAATDPVAYAKSLLDQGTAPQYVAAKVNDQFKLGTGSQAVYYGPEAHGGTATIGLPGAYLAQDGPNGSWSITNRGSGVATTAAAKPAYGQSVGALSTWSPGTTPYTPVAPALSVAGYQPARRVYGSIGSMVG